jgi:PTS system nitrogen regulatory IIA component
VTNPEKSTRTANNHPLINQLVQLQELILVRSEQEASMTDKYTSQLDNSINALRGSLPEETQQLFQKIEKRDVLAIVPISNNVCSGCGLSLPVSLIYAVRAGEKLFQCPNCARILYYPEARSRRISTKVGGRSMPRRTGIARFSSQSLMLPELNSTERDKVIEEMAMRMESEGFVDDGAKLITAALEREAIINTAVEHGLAFPHVRGVEGGGLTLALGINRKGVRFDTAGRGLTHIIFFIVIPTAASVFYLRLLSGLTQTFYRKDAREKLLAAQNSEELWSALVKTTRYTIK